MNLRTFSHEDDRRTLVEWIKDIPVKCLKTIYVKSNAPLGDHYHNNKDEIFYVAKGKGVYKIREPRKNSKIYRQWIYEGECIKVDRGLVHTFEMQPGSILLEAATEPYNHEDEIPFVE